VRKVREAKGLTQPELAQKSGVKQTTISDIEKGKSKHPRSVAELARVLETSEGYLWGLTDDPRATQQNRSQATPLDRVRNGTRKYSSGAIAGDAYDTDTALTVTRNLLPIYGTSFGGVGKMLLTAEPIDRVRGPGRAEAVPHAYYVQICNADMVPAYWPGDELLIYPEHPVYEGRDYLLLTPKIEGEQQMCKVRRVTKITPTHWECIAWGTDVKDDSVSRADFPVAQWIEAKRNR
jgi:transcriptional regulator with XRE-family HTH domain